jgi:hypothetical protein
MARADARWLSGTASMPDRMISAVYAEYDSVSAVTP